MLNSNQFRKSNKYFRIVCFGTMKTVKSENSLSVWVVLLEMLMEYVFKGVSSDDPTSLQREKDNRRGYQCGTSLIKTRVYISYIESSKSVLKEYHYLVRQVAFCRCIFQLLAIYLLMLCINLIDVTFDPFNVATVNHLLVIILL